MTVDDPLRQLIELQRSINLPKPIDFDEQARAAAQTAESILDADPGLGPMEVVYIARDEDVLDQRYLIVLFQGEKGFLIDRTVGRTMMIELDDRGLSGDEWLEANWQVQRPPRPRPSSRKSMLLDEAQSALIGGSR